MQAKSQPTSKIRTVLHNLRKQQIKNPSYYKGISFQSANKP